MRVALLANLRFLSGQVMGKVTNQIIYLPDARDAPRGVSECRPTCSLRKNVSRRWFFKGQGHLRIKTGVVIDFLFLKTR